MCSGRRQISVVTCHPRESELCYLTDAVQATCRLGARLPELYLSTVSHKALLANERPLCAPEAVARSALSNAGGDRQAVANAYGQITRILFLTIGFLNRHTPY